MTSAPSSDYAARERGLSAAAEINRLHQKIDQMKKQIAAAEKRRDQAQAEAIQAVAVADRAERAEWQISAERDRWKRLAMAYESELRSLVPHYGASAGAPELRRQV